MSRSRAAAVTLAVTGLLSGTAHADIDHRLNSDESGIWARHNQLTLQNVSALAVAGGALWEGNDTRLGRTLWKSTEAMISADLSAAGLKRITRRARPTQGNDPHDWFGASGHNSFPSGEVTHIAAIVTPLIAEYAHDRPAVWTLAALPAYVGAARLKSQAHWQTDVLAGAVLGTGIGFYEYTLESAWSTTVLPRGLTVGFHRQF